MSEVGSYERDNGIGIVTIDSPPVNSLSIHTRRALTEGIQRFNDDETVDAIVIICAGRTFFAGAEITELGKPPVAPTLHDVLAMIDASAKPVIAAIHGTALGGGFELALTCHSRIAVPSAKVGLPEVNLGLLPGAGGTQRLPRLVGPVIALDIMTGGKPVAAAKALDLGMIDALAGEGNLRADVIAFARAMLDSGVLPSRIGGRQDKVEPARGHPEIFAEFRKANARAFRGFKAPENIIKAVEAAVELPFEEGLQVERQLFLELLDSTESAAQRYFFFAERESAKVPGLAADLAPLPVSAVGVIGAGTMGGGITMNFLNAGIPVTLVETSQAALDRGIGVIRRNYESAVAKGRMSAAQLDPRMGLITPVIGLEALARADLVIEAVFEDMAVKKDIFGQLDRIAKPEAILASNTSYLDLDEIAAATWRPEAVIGLHFFSPANVMRLLEIVRGAKTADRVLATALGLAKSIGKVPVVSRVCHGFIANRVMSQRGSAANDLILMGPTPQEIDAALSAYGFAMGPFQMNDLVGLDVIGRNATERTVRGDLVAMGRLGQKQNGGFYDYDGQRRPTPSPVAAQVIADFAAYKGITTKLELSQQEIVARLLYPVINEGAKLLEEGIAIRASDIDVACILGYNWPVYTGGPMFWADTIGLSRVVQGLDSMGIQPARSLVENANSGLRFTN